MTKVPKLKTSIKYKCMTGAKDQLWLNLDHESYHVALKQADKCIFPKGLVCVSSVKIIVWLKYEEPLLFLCSFKSFL